MRKKSFFLVVFMIFASCGKSDQVPRIQVDDGADGRDGRDGERGPIGPSGSAGPVGPMGPVGPVGKDGESCFVTDHPEGAAIVCGNSTQVIRDGANGQGCYVEAIKDQDASRLVCGSSVQVIKNGKDGIDGAKGSDGKDGKSGESCKVWSEHGAIVIDCGSNGRETIPAEKTITICQSVNCIGQTKTYKVSDFIANVYGKYNYSVGACRH